jgi:dihydrofolate reductase
MITIIAAVAKNRAIGFKNKLIYWLPNDLKRFKALTTGHTIIMGRNTFLSLPKGALPNRRNIVLSRSAFVSPPKLGGVRGGLRSTFGRLLPQGRKNDGQNTNNPTALFPNCDVYPSLDEALAHCAPDEDIYIIGGASVYRQALPLADRLCLTEIDDTPAEADTFFPPYEDDWQEESREDHPVDDRHDFPYSFVDYIRR